jgi:hypothetical protein
VIEVTPRELLAGQRSELRGEYLRPFLRVFAVESGGTFQISERAEWPAEGKYWLRTTSEAQIEIPNLAPGTYDLALFAARICWPRYRGRSRFSRRFRHRASS